MFITVAGANTPALRLYRRGGDREQARHALEPPWDQASLTETTVPEGRKDGRSPWDTGLAAHRQEWGSGRASSARKWPGRGESSGALGLPYDRDRPWPRPAGTLQGADAQGPSVAIGGKGPPGPPLSVWCPRPCTPASPSAHSSPNAAPCPGITEPMLRPPAPHCRAPRTVQGTTRSIRIHASRHAPPNVHLLLLPCLRNLSSLPATRVKTLSLVLTQPTAVPSQSLLALTSNQNPPAHTCTPLTTLGPECRWEPLLGLPTLALAPASAPHTAPKETAVRSDPISATQIHLPMAPHFTPSK